MRIAIDLTPLHNRKWTGVELYAIDLYKALCIRGFNVIPIFNQTNDIDDNKAAYIIKDSGSRLFLENIELSKAIRTIKADIALFPIFPPPVDLYYFRPSKIVPIIHDTAFIHYYKTLKFTAKYYLTPKYKIALKKADYLVTISETSKKNLSKHTFLNVINWGENISFDFKRSNLVIQQKNLDLFGLQRDSYYISVSTIEPRKNLKYLIQTLRDTLIEKNRKLVLVGRKGWGGDKELERLIKEVNDHLVFTEYIALETLQSLYHYAHAFVLLSIDEGFGRTPLEAMACGCKNIIVSDIEIFHETLGDSGNYLPLNDMNSCIQSFKKDEWRSMDSDFIIPFNVLENKIYFI